MRGLSYRVGPHGYIHGWIFVGAPGVGAKVFHPQHGHGTVISHTGTHATVRFHNGNTHSFEARRGPGSGRLTPRGRDESAQAQAYAASLQGKLKPRQLDNYDVAEYKRTRLDPLYSYSPQQMKATEQYCETKYKEINEAAREGRDPGPVADAISSAMKPLPDDLILLRELSGADAMAGLKPGDVIADPAFASTTLTSRGHFASGRANTTVMHILTPKGTPALYADPASGFPEDEMILDRGTRMVIMKSNPRPGREGFVTDVYLLALPKGA